MVGLYQSQVAGANARQVSIEMDLLNISMSYPVKGLYRSALFQIAVQLQKVSPSSVLHFFFLENCCRTLATRLSKLYHSPNHLTHLAWKNG